VFYSPCHDPVEITLVTFDFTDRRAVLVIVRDITGRRRAADVLREVNRKLNLLFSITCHEILNQLTAYFRS